MKYNMIYYIKDNIWNIIFIICFSYVYFYMYSILYCVYVGDHKAFIININSLIVIKLRLIDLAYFPCWNIFWVKKITLMLRWWDPLVNRCNAS